MRQIAERLAHPFAFVRVDLYTVGDRILVGELTHYPTGGNKSYDPPEWEARLGALWPEPHPALGLEAGRAWLGLILTLAHAAG
jgi:hypothetical protein